MNMKMIGAAVLAGAMIAGCGKNEEKAEDVMAVFAVALLVGGIYLIATGHPTGGYALAGASAFTGIVTMALVLAAVVRVNKGERWN